MGFMAVGAGKNIVIVLVGIFIGSHRVTALKKKEIAAPALGIWPSGAG